MSSFSTLSLSSSMKDNLTRLGYKTMTDIQRESIPPILEGRDILAQAKTGSGKTAAFGIGLLEGIDTTLWRVQALILCPTRELAVQVTQEIRKLAQFKENIKLVTLTGASPQYIQENSLKHQAHIVVGTPGRVQKLLKRGSLSLDHLQFFILDEADRMLEMGFVGSVKDIAGYISKKHKTLCFSATYPDEVLKFCRGFQSNPVEILLDSVHEASVITQRFFRVPPQNKALAAVELISEFTPSSAIVFCNTKDACRSVEREFRRRGVPCLAMHGDIDQKQRTEALVRFSNGSCRVLIATDVAARGLDIDTLEAVINYDMPFEADTYIHRIGRTGRAGREGYAWSLIEPGEEFRIDFINEKLRISTSVEEMIRPSRSSKADLSPSFVTISINGGRKAKIGAGDIVGALTSDGRISGSDIGQIDRMEHLSFIAISPNVVEIAVENLQRSPVKGRSLLVRVHR